jgi:hypothetical protein
MSTALEVLPGGKPVALERVVEAARRLEEHEEVDRWEFADDVREAVDALAESQNGFETRGMGPAAQGFYAAIDEVNSALTDAGIITVGRQSIVGAYTTAKAWPAEDRVEGATYWAHYELRGRDWDNRRARVLRRLLTESSRGRVGPQIVRTWKASVRPADLTPFLDKVERRLRSAIHAATKPWNQVAEDDRQEIGRILRRLADEVQTGEFT